jgi:conjugal transfer pilin signal peptidase TrbI
MPAMLIAFLKAIPARCTAIASDQPRMRFLKNSLVGTALAFLVVGAGVTAFRQQYRIGVDIDPVRCLPEHVYWVKLHAPADVRRGAVVAFIAPHGLMLPRFDGKMIAKEVAGLPGDHIVVKSDRAYVNGVFAGRLILNAKLGRGPGGFDRDEIVPPGKVFLLGTLPRSYDSRYWGFLDQKRLIGAVTPLF